MDLLKYLEPMKNLPDRFSNLAFWRGVRKLKNEVVNAFEYIESWGNNIESELANSGMKIIKTVLLTSDMVSYNAHDNTYFTDIQLTNIADIPVNAKIAIVNLYLEVKVGNQTYTFECRGVTPIDNGQIIYRYYRAICTRTITIDSQPTYKLMQSHIWYFG